MLRGKVQAEGYRRADRKDAGSCLHRHDIRCELVIRIRRVSLGSHMEQAELGSNDEQSLLSDIRGEHLAN